MTCSDWCWISVQPSYIHPLLPCLISDPHNLASFYVSKMQDLSSSCCANIAKLFPCKADSIRRIYTQLSHICRTEEWEQKPLKGEDLNSECFRLRDTFMRQVRWYFLALETSWEWIVKSKEFFFLVWFYMTAKNSTMLVGAGLWASGVLLSLLPVQELQELTPVSGLSLPLKMQGPVQVFVHQTLYPLSHLSKIIFICINCWCSNPIFLIRTFQIILELTEASLNEAMQQDAAGEMFLYFSFSAFQPSSFKFSA